MTCYEPARLGLGALKTMGMELRVARGRFGDGGLEFGDGVWGWSCVVGNQIGDVVEDKCREFGIRRVIVTSRG